MIENVTISQVEGTAIQLENSHDNTIKDSYIILTGIMTGIRLINSNNNSIIGNKIFHDSTHWAMESHRSHHDLIPDNMFEGPQLIDRPSSNTLSNDTDMTELNDQTFSGSIFLSSATNNNIIQNRVSVVSLQSSTANLLRNNELNSIVVMQSPNNTIIFNDLFNAGLNLDGTTITEVEQALVANNTVNGKPLIFLQHQSGIVINDTDIGQVILVNSQNITLKGSRLETCTCEVYRNGTFICRRS